jgi:hypothetical protein
MQDLHLTDQQWRGGRDEPIEAKRAGPAARDKQQRQLRV